MYLPHIERFRLRSNAIHDRDAPFPDVPFLCGVAFVQEKVILCGKKINMQYGVELYHKI